MNGRIWIATALLTSAGALVASAAPRAAAPARKPRPARKVAAPATTRSMTPEQARTAVRMLGDAYDLILDETHATYHTKPSVPVAATVVRKLQAKMNALGWPRARFLAVNAVVMHPDHVPRDDFERLTVQTLRRGEDRVEQVVDGQLRVSTVVPLGGGCSSCHWTPSGQSSKAAITWSVPLRQARERGR
jgi:hypothetical protein